MRLKSLDVGKAIDKRPGVARHAEFATHLRERMAAKGYTNTFDVAKRVTGSRTGAVANWQKYQWPEARWWPALRDLLDLDGSWGDVIAEAERETVATKPGSYGYQREGERWGEAEQRLTTPATPEAERWDGWGTALKPAHEPIVVARKPLAGTVAANVLEHGTGALNVDGCRVGLDPGYSYPNGPGGCGAGEFHYQGRAETPAESNPHGRWPANVVLDERAAGMLDEQTGERPTGDLRPYERANRDSYSGAMPATSTFDRPGDSGGASRFFYCAKSSRVERNAGLEGFEDRSAGVGDRRTSGDMNERLHRGEREHVVRQNFHPTVKPLALMRWLVRLVCPPGGTVLDPFTGSGTTGCAAVLEGFGFIGLEREAEYVEIAKARLAYWADPAKAEAALAFERAALEREAEDRLGGQMVFDTGEEAA